MINTIDELNENSIDIMTQDDVYEVLDKIIRPLNVETRKVYMDKIRKKFDFRSINQTKKRLKRDMEIYGYKFFKIPNNENMIMGIKRKA